jgi:NACalpha-BTF3-like transcription factor
MWFAPVVSLVLISIGLGFNSLVLVRHMDRKIEAITLTLKNIEQIQEAIQKKQKEQSSSPSAIVPTLQAFSQLYLDYLTKQQREEEQQENIKDD